MVVAALARVDYLCEISDFAALSLAPSCAALTPARWRCQSLALGTYRRLRGLLAPIFDRVDL
jgi:hypothetical protein